ncbi:MAG: HAD hydrolase-like protein [Flavobacteriales bacterium]|nr:HAD hydrolase-like protein [Flavobacteriales bacterium]
MIKLLILDMAGTTVRDLNEVEKCFAEACKITGLQVDDATIKAVQGWSKIYVFEKLWKEQLGENHPNLELKIKHSFQSFKDILETYYQTHEILPTEGAMEVFEFCKKHKIKVVLTTGFYRKVTDLILERLGWMKGLNEQRIAISSDAIIDASISSDEVANGRPAPDLVFKAMNIFKINDPKEIVVVGDTPSDLGCGKNAGALLTIGVTNGTHPKELLEPLPHDKLIPSLKKLPEVLIPYLYN